MSLPEWYKPLEPMSPEAEAYRRSWEYRERADALAKGYQAAFDALVEEYKDVCAGSKTR